MSNPFSLHVFFLGVKLGEIWLKLSCTLLFEWKVIVVEINLKACKINPNTIGYRLPIPIQLQPLHPILPIRYPHMPPLVRLIAIQMPQHFPLILLKSPFIHF